MSETLPSTVQSSDVYKRQVKGMVQGFPEKLLGTHYAAGVAAVSYTHLDVYKRQVKLLCKAFPVALGLVEHIHKIAVFKNVLHLAGR